MNSEDLARKLANLATRKDYALGMVALVLCGLTVILALGAAQ
jgi:hypothetical protein